MNRCGTTPIHLEFQTEGDFPNTLTKVDIDKRAYGRALGIRLQSLPDLEKIGFSIDWQQLASEHTSTSASPRDLSLPNVLWSNTPICNICVSGPIPWKVNDSFLRHHVNHVPNVKSPISHSPHRAIGLGNMLRLLLGLPNRGDYIRLDLITVSAH